MIPVLDGARVRLRGFTWADFAPFAAMWREPEIARHIPFAPVPDTQSWARFNGDCYRWATKGYGNWAVCGPDGAFIGVTGFFERNPGSGAPLEAGWVFRSAVHGQGYASEATGLSHAWLDQQVIGGVSRCMMGPDHAASIRVAEKCGYRHLRDESDLWGPVRLMERRKTVVGAG